MSVSNVLFLIICFVLFPFDAIAKDDSSVRVEKIIDGDTIQVQYKAKSVQVRLWGIDTPEYQQPFSKPAKKFTAQLLEEGRVQLKIKDWDRYGRIVAIVTMTDQRCVNEELIKAGFAWVHIYYCKEPICKRWSGYEKEARLQQIGLWQDSSPVPPWVWKKKNKRWERKTH